MSQYLIDAKVTGYTSPMAARVIYAGSTFWFLGLVAIDITHLIATNDNGWRHAVMLSANCAMFVVQSINVWYALFRFWPLVSVYYALQIWVLGLRATDESIVGSIELLAQSIFTASQLSVTLEYLHRVAASEVPHASHRATTTSVHSLPPRVHVVR